MNRPRSADDFATIRARMKELRREREQAEAAKGDLDRPMARTRTDRRPSREVSAEPSRVRQSGAARN